MTQPEALLTAREAAAYFRVDVKTIRRWAQRGTITSSRTPGGALRFRHADLASAVLPPVQADAPAGAA